MKQAIVLVNNNLPTMACYPSLIGYYSLHTEYADITDDIVREHLLNTLPEYMVPQVFMKVDVFPLNNNGKINRNEVAMIAIKFNKKDVIKPTNNIEEVLVKIWSDVLKTSECIISITDNFFKLGGNSILCIRLLREINDKLQISVDISSVLNYTNIRDYAVFLTNQSNNYLQIEGVI